MDVLDLSYLLPSGAYEPPKRQGRSIVSTCIHMRKPLPFMCAMLCIVVLIAYVQCTPNHLHIWPYIPIDMLIRIHANN